MLKTITFISLSLSALLFSGYNKNEAPQRNSHAAADTTLLKVGDKVPDILFSDSASRDVKISGFKGKYVLIDVWASWCSPCRAQQPYLMKIEEKMKNKNIVFLGISIDTRVWRWKGPMLAQMAGTQWIVKNTNFEKAFGINMIPRFILLDKNGNVLKLNMPLPSHPELEEELSKLKGI